MNFATSARAARPLKPGFLMSKSPRPVISSMCLKPMLASKPRTSSATENRYALVCSGCPLKISGEPVIPVGQFGIWHDLHTMQPTDTIERLAEADIPPHRTGRI